MHRRAFLSCLSTSLAAAGCRTQPHLPALRVLTYNTHHGEGNGGRIDLDRIAAVIREARPDVVALQELDNRARRSGRVAQTDAAAAHHPQPTNPSEAPRERIDYLLLHPHGAWKMSSSEGIAETIASDHRPLGAELCGPIRQ